MWSEEMQAWLLERGFLPRNEKERIQRKWARDQRQQYVRAKVDAYYKEQQPPPEPPPVAVIVNQTSLKKLQDQINNLRVELSLQNLQLCEHIDMTAPKKKQLKHSGAVYE